ncbi:MAG TPA: TRAP transporter TatT component family protein [Candidatus Eisenbacteria bacterium]|nr:TRAP transporter TatT component family protein [Candidatus Eisenbacteria bacterium]
MARRLLALLTIAALFAGVTSCSIRKMATKSVANSLTSGPDVFGTDEDPQLIKDAIPFGLKTMESLLQTLPHHQGLLLSLCRGFTQYGVAFVQSEADEVEAVDYTKAAAIRERALKMYLRARGYGLRGLEVSHRGLTRRLLVTPDSAAREIKRGELPMLYWTAAAWGSAINLGKDRADLLADLGTVRAMMERGLALDEKYDGGAFHEAMIILEALPREMGGSPERARAHFHRAVQLSNGRKASPYVTLAQTVSVMSQNRYEFRELLEKALAVDPDLEPGQRLATLVVQEQARKLLKREDDLFLEPATPNPKDNK